MVIWCVYVEKICQNHAMWSLNVSCCIQLKLVATTCQRRSWYRRCIIELDLSCIRVTVMFCTAEARREADEPAGLLVGGGADFTDGETWHRHRRQHSSAHQQHLWAKLCHRVCRSPTQSYDSGRSSCARLSEGRWQCYNMRYLLSISWLVAFEQQWK